jgi:hypothetical protein
MKHEKATLNARRPVEHGDRWNSPDLLQASMIGPAGKPGPNHRNNQIRAVGESVLQDLCENKRRSDDASGARWDTRVLRGRYSWS